MTRSQSGGRRRPRKQVESNQRLPNVLQTTRQLNEANGDDLVSEELSNIKSLLIDDEAKNSKAGTSSTGDDMNTASLHNELDSFRQRWKRELETKNSISQDEAKSNIDKSDEKENRLQSKDSTTKEFYAALSNPPDDPRDVYALAKRLFLIGVELERDELHHESIRYYKQAMHLYPDIERQIFREQSEASLKSNKESKSEVPRINRETESVLASVHEEGQLPLVERLSCALSESSKDGYFSYCRPTSKQKAEALHISELPRDLLLLIFRYVIGNELDLASLEILGMVCRGFFILSRDNSLWMSICSRTWGDKLSLRASQIKGEKQIDWRQTYLEKPRTNHDGVYISRTRYLRFFSDRRVLILTTNEEPERIIPIFRHALHAKQFSSELSILEGTYELIDTNILVITAEKDFSLEKSVSQSTNLSQKRQRDARFHWSRQTPLSQRFDYKFELKTQENRPYRNNILKWLEYSITTRLETGGEVTTFDLTYDSFPNLLFSRVKTFNLRQTEPLSNH